MTWMNIAWSQLGVSEIKGSTASPEILAMFRDAGHPEISSDETAWCAAFVASCLVRAGVSIESVPRAQRLSARAWAKFGVASEPRPSAIAVFSRDEAGPQAGHVGFVLEVDGNDITVIDGNAGNKVSVSRIPRSRLIACRMPHVTDAEVVPAASQPAPEAAPKRSGFELITKSRTIRGALWNVLGAVVLFFQQTLEVMLEAAEKIQSFSPIQGALASVGANVPAIGIGFVVWGTTWVVLGRFLAEKKA